LKRVEDGLDADIVVIFHWPCADGERWRGLRHWLARIMEGNPSISDVLVESVEVLRAVL